MISLLPVTRMKTLILLPRCLMAGWGVVLKVILLWLITGRGWVLLKPLLINQKDMSTAVFVAFSKIVLTGVDYKGNRHPWF